MALVVLRYLGGYLFSVVVGAAVLFRVWKVMWQRAKGGDVECDLQQEDWLAKVQGVTERALYTTCIVLHRPEGIAVWLAFKAIQRVRVREESDTTHIPGTAIYLTGNALSLAFGAAGGWIALWSVTLS